ncbi:MAG: hypothetical protein EXR72_14495 [Myxococcales bacterium]|nr:hypothetical protein [Myxococcales bacterium]
MRLRPLTLSCLLPGLLAAGCLGVSTPPQPTPKDAATTDAPVTDAGAVVVDATAPAPVDLASHHITIDYPIDASVVAVDARAKFDAQVKPLLNQRCAPCHGKEGGLGPAFLKPNTYDSVVAWPKLITRDPTHSLLVTKGAHSGASWFAPGELLILLDWLSVEAAALPKSIPQSVTTPPLTPMPGANSIPLGALGKDFLGAEITFDVTFIGTTLKLSDINVRATGATGLHVVHPLFFVLAKGVKKPDPVDSFENVDLTVPNAKSLLMGPGVLFLHDVFGLDQIALAFSTFTVAGGGAMQMGGCKSVVDFTMSVQPTLAMRCVLCHGGTNDTATNALDMRKVADLSMGGQATACAQVKNRIDPMTPAMSQIFLITAPMAPGNHLFKFPDQKTYDAFVQSATLWITKEN